VTLLHPEKGGRWHMNYDLTGPSVLFKFEYKAADPVVVAILY
jgi:hypothetical protein